MSEPRFPSSSDRLDIDPAIVRRLIAARFPQWAALPVSRVEPGGWDNRTFRLGDEFVVRMPSGARYADKIEKEQRWLPQLAPLLPFAIPVPVAMGEPGEGYPWRWSIRRWIEGECASRERIDDVVTFAIDLASFLRALQKIAVADAPAAGKHNFHRGGSLRVYDEETYRAIDALCNRIDADRATAIWNEALTSMWRTAPVWIHGDLTADNLLVQNGRLHAVIDFGGCAVGDPACDLTMAWTFFDGEDRVAFRDAIQLDADTWSRARGWALWKSLITVAVPPNAKRAIVSAAEQTLDAVLSASADDF